MCVYYQFEMCVTFDDLESFVDQRYQILLDIIIIKGAQMPHKTIKVVGHGYCVHIIVDRQQMVTFTA